MPTVQYTTVADSDFSRGLDARSSESQIDQGFVRDLLNMDVVEKRVKKRNGYQNHSGGLPVRVTRVVADSTAHTLVLSLDTAVSLETAVSLTNVATTPLVLYGRSSVLTAGPVVVDQDSAHYYTGFTVASRKQLLAPGGSLVIPEAEHGIPSTQQVVQVVESTSDTDESYSRVDLDSVSVSTSNYDVTLGYTVADSVAAYPFFVDARVEPGYSYVATLTHAGGGAQSFVVPASTHALATLDLIPVVQLVAGGQATYVTPDSVTLTNSGTLTVTLTSTSAATYQLLLLAAPVSQSSTGVVGVGGSGSVSLPDLERPWFLPAIYVEQTPGGTRELVLEQSTTYDAPSKAATLTFDNQGPARQFTVYYVYGSIRSNELTITDASVTQSGTDTAPQVTLWGLDHATLYGPSAGTQAGWVNLVDSYRAAGEQQLVSALGGNLFADTPQELGGDQYLMPTLYPRLSGRTSTSTVVGPLLYDTGSTPGTTRGWVTSDHSAGHTATVTSVHYDPGSGYTVYRLALPGKQVYSGAGTPTTLGAIVSVTPGLEDYLTVSGMSYSVHEGSWPVRQVVEGVGYADLYCSGPAPDPDGIYTDTGCQGLGGVYSARLPLTLACPFLPGDTLYSPSIALYGPVAVLGGLVDSVNVTGVTQVMAVPAGVVVLGMRTSNLVPLRTASPNSQESTYGLVSTDELLYTGLQGDHSLTALRVNPSPTQLVSVVGDGTTATVSLGTPVPTLVAGDLILVTASGLFDGVWELTYATPTELGFASTVVGTAVVANLSGCTVVLGEELAYSDSPDQLALSVPARWVPVEAPGSSQTGPGPLGSGETTTRYWVAGDYDSQAPLRTSMLQNSLFLQNGTDSPRKYDGANVYRPGLLPWQPGLLLTQDTTGSVIVADLRTITTTAVSPAAGSVTIDPSAVGSIPVGATVQISGVAPGVTYQVAGYSTNTSTNITTGITSTNNYLLLDRSLDSAATAGTVKEIGVYRYYFRLQAIDATGAVVASAVTSSTDYTVELATNAAVLLRMVGTPPWDVYDYARHTVQIYRTKLRTAAPYYLVTTLPIDFGAGLGYLTYRDTFADSNLTELDSVVSALKGQELGVAWSDPLRGRYVTALGNRLISANVQDYPQLDLQLLTDATAPASLFSGMGYLLRRDSTDTGETTDMVNRVRYVYRASLSGSGVTVTPGSGQFVVGGLAAGAVSTGSWIYLTYASVATSGRALDYCGWYQVASASGTTATITLPHAAAATSYPDSYVVVTGDSRDVPVYLGTDGSMGMVGADQFPLFEAGRRLSLAINATMRMVDTTLTAFSGYQAWLVARGGNDLGQAGHVVVRQPRYAAVTPSLETSGTPQGLRLFVNSVLTGDGLTTEATTALFPSRLLVSYPNYPEILDNPTAPLDTDSDSAIDVDPSNGQPITAVIPFFGSSVSSYSLLSTYLVVFKTNSIYLVDLSQKGVAGGQLVHRLETDGLGCTAPYSVTTTKQGIMFANESGVYCLKQDQTIEWVGRYLGRLWTDQVDQGQLQLVQGHHSGVDRTYRISVPLTGQTANSDVYCYNHTTESPSQGTLGAWSRWDNHPVTSWCNLASSEFLGSTQGKVYLRRSDRSYARFRDAQGVILASLQTRPTDFGSPSIRKVIDGVVIHYRATTSSLSTQVAASTDLSANYYPGTPARVPASPTYTPLTGLSDQAGYLVYTLRHSLTYRRCVYLSMQISNAGADEGLEIAGLEYRVAGLTQSGITSAGTGRG